MKASQRHVPSLLAAILFSLGALFLFGIGLLMGVTTLTSLLTSNGIRAEQTIFLISFGFEGIVLSIAAFVSIQKYRQKPHMEEVLTLPNANRWILLLLLAAGVSFLAGYLISPARTINWVILPILTIPAIVIPLGILLLFGTRRLPLGTRWQTWSALGLSMTLTPILLLALEAIIGIVLFILIVAYIMTQPELSSRLQAIAQRIMILGPQSEAAQALLIPLLVKPGVIASALFYTAVLVPAVEELFKPLGVWLFASRLESAARGFTLGALSGAGYALIETVGVSGQQAADWASLLLSRVGTGLLHITTSALMGAAIVLAWRERHYLRLVGTYLLAVILHGLWNTGALLFSFSSLADALNQLNPLNKFQPVVVVAMMILAVILFVILVIANRSMRRLVPPLLEPTIPDQKVDLP